QTNDSVFYIFFYNCMKYPDLVSLTERTMTQLKNAGGMRLIRNKKAADSIILYDDCSKKLVDQQIYYEKYLNAFGEQGTKLLNWKYYQIDPNTLLFKGNADSLTSARILSNDKMKIIELGNIAVLYQLVVTFYITRLQEANDHAVNLIRTLKNEYDIK